MNIFTKGDLVQYILDGEYTSEDMKELNERYAPFKVESVMNIGDEEEYAKHKKEDGFIIAPDILYHCISLKDPEFWHMSTYRMLETYKA